MLLVIQPVLTAEKLHMDHQYFLMVNHQKNKVVWCRPSPGIELPIKKFLFTSKNILFCQNQTSIFEAHLKTKSDCFSLEYMPDGLRLKIGLSGV